VVPLAFIDIAGLPAESQAAIEYLARGEIVKGVSALSYAPSLGVTREQMALYLHRVINWPVLAADEAIDSTAFVMVFASLGVGGGSASWRAPRVLMTNQHVAITTTANDSGGYTYSENDFIVKANGGWVRSDRSPTGEPAFRVIWDRYHQDWRDIAYLIVPEVLWEKYLAARVAAGLPREPRYINLREARDVVQGEPILVTGSPLMYDNVISTGIVSKVQVSQNSNGNVIEYVMTTAAINPGNSGGLAMTFDRKPVGIPSLKPWTHTGFGWSIGDDMGLILHWREILAWEEKFKHEFGYVGVTL